MLWELEAEQSRAEQSRCEIDNVVGKSNGQIGTILPSNHRSPFCETLLVHAASDEHHSILQQHNLATFAAVIYHLFSRQSYVLDNFSRVYCRA